MVIGAVNADEWGGAGCVLSLPLIGESRRKGGDSPRTKAATRRGRVLFLDREVASFLAMTGIFLFELHDLRLGQV